MVFACYMRLNSSWPLFMLRNFVWINFILVAGDILDSHDLSWHCELLIFPKNNFQSGKKLLCFECFQHSAFYGCSIHESRPHSAVGENKSDLPLIHTLPLLPKSTNLQIGCIQIPIPFPSPSCHLHQKAERFEICRRTSV